VPGARGSEAVPREKSRAAPCDSAQLESSRIAAGLALTWIHNIKDDTSFLPGGLGALRGGESMG